jgi:hypothetical protein
MLEGHETKRLLQAYFAGIPPPPRLAPRCLVGLDALMTEWRRDLDEYVAKGGSLLRIVQAPAGSGKTHLGEALKGEAAERGFVVCQVDAQSQRSSGDDLQLYAGFCSGLRLPAQYLDGASDEGGLLGILEDVAARLSPTEVREALKAIRLPAPALKDMIVAVVDAITTKRFSGASAEGWQAMVAAIAGEKPPRLTTLAKLRRAYPEAFGSVKRIPGKRDARLWLESLLLCLRPLGFPGALLIVDEHDERKQSTLDGAIVQLRHQLDRLAEGHLPGTFVLYLVLDDFPGRVEQAHVALHQRIAPLVPGKLSTRLLTRLEDLRDATGKAFLTQVGRRLHELVLGGPPPDEIDRQIEALAAKNQKLHGVDTRNFVKALAEVLEA